MTDEPTTTPDETEQAAGCYLMVQFKDPDSVDYTHVMSTPAPAALAVISALRDIVNRLETVLSFQREVKMMQASQAQQATLPCKNCGALLDQATTAKVLSGGLAFCAKCHQRVA